MSQTYASAIISLLVIVLPMFGIKVGSDALTVTVQTVIVMGAQIWIMIRRLQQGDITILGGRI